MRKVLLTASGLIAALAFASGCGPGNGGDAGTDVPVRADTATDTGSEGGGHDAGTDAMASLAGRACTDDSMCGSDGVLTCDTTDFAAYSSAQCAGTCTNNTSAAMEAAECDGTGSTCLEFGESGSANYFAFCTHHCNATTTSTAMTGCLANQICTGFWNATMTGTPDSAGCYPFCHADAECATGMHCNTYTGECGATGTATTGAVDGANCNTGHDGMMGHPASDCRSGICYIIVTGSTHGMCGSIIDTHRGTTCPDDPNGMISPQAVAGDNFGICVFPQCSCDSDCAAPQVCVAVTTSISICKIPDPAATPPEMGTVCPSDGGTDGSPGTDAATDAATGTDSGTDSATDSGVGVDAALPDVTVGDL